VKFCSKKEFSESYILTLVARMSQEQKNHRRGLWIAIAILLIVVFFTVRFMTRDHLQVRVSEVTRGALISTISTNGRVEPEEDISLLAPDAAQVKTVNVQPGDVVKAGQVLMTLDDVEARAHVATAESGVKSAQAGLDAIEHNGSLQERQQAGADLSRAKLDRNEAARAYEAINRLKASGAASLGEVMAAKQRLESSEATLKALEESARGHYSPSDLARAKAALADAQAQLMAARSTLDKMQIKAPCAGTIYAVNVTRTEMAEAGHPLIQMADLGKLRIRAYFDEPEIGKLAEGQKIQITWDARQGRTWEGHIERVPVTVTTYGTRNVGEVLVKVDSTDGGLLPQTNVTVRATLSTQADALNIPREALRSEAGKPYVFKVVGDELVKTPVVPGTINLTQAAILSGLVQGEKVATATVNGQPLQEGLPIKATR